MEVYRSSVDSKNRGFRIRTCDVIISCMPHSFLCAKTGRKIAPNTGANATKFFTLATKS